MTELWIATGNPKKRVELDRLLSPLGFALRLQSEHPEPIEIVEDCPDFAGNAAKKAVTVARAVGGLAVGDDSGICVDALNGRPGVLSARYAGPDATDTDRIEKMLGELSDVPMAARTGRFVCSVCLAGPDGSVLAAFEETCEGVVQTAPRGDGGFGYDPIFVAREYSDDGRCFAELTAEEKDRISHRGKALRLLHEWLEQHRTTL